MKRSIALTLSILLFALGAVAQKSALADSIIDSYYQDGNPGVAVSVIQDGQSIYNHEVGMANIEHNIPISDSSAFLIASVSKQFTAYLALLLEQQGKLNMDDDIRTYLPELGHLEHRITLSQMANHTHGLPNVSELVNLKGFGISDRMWHSDMVDMALRIETFNFKPGDAYQYNNTGFLLLSEIIARVSEMSFQECLQTYIFKPLGMKNTAAVSSPNTIIKNKVESYAIGQDGYVRFDSNIMTNGSAGIRTTIIDLGKWAAHFQSTFHKTDAPFTKMIEATNLNDGTVQPYGLGLETRDYKGDQVVFHGGGTAGYRAYLLHLPAQRISVIVMGNGKDYWPIEVAYGIADIYSGKSSIGVPAFEIGEYTKEELQKFEGTYEFFPGQYYVFSEEQDTLYLSFIGKDEKFPLENFVDNSFSFPFYPSSTFTFHKNKVELQIADFLYSCKKVDLVLKDYAIESLQKFVGLYYNTTLNTTYEIAIDHDQLVAKHPINYDMSLKGLEDDSFYSSIHFFGVIKFDSDEKGGVTGFKLSAQNMKGLKFLKISTQ